MILDEFGQPIRKPIGFITPRWIQDSMAKMLKADVDAYSNLVIETAVDDLYESDGVERQRETRVGNTITVKVPERYRR